MAYDTDNPPCLLTTDWDNTAPRLWSMSGADAIATVAAAGYISNAYELGMQVGDIVYYYNTTSSLMSQAWVSAVVEGTGATLSTTFTATA